MLRQLEAYFLNCFVEVQSKVAVPQGVTLLIPLFG